MSVAKSTRGWTFWHCLRQCICNRSLSSQQQWQRGFKRWKAQQSHSEALEKRLRKQEKKQRRAIIRRALNNFVESGQESKIQGIKWRPDSAKKDFIERGEEAFENCKQPWTSKRRAKSGKNRPEKSRRDMYDQDLDQDSNFDWTGEWSSHAYESLFSGRSPKKRSRAWHQWEGYAYHAWHQCGFTNYTSDHGERYFGERQSYTHQFFSQTHHSEKQEQKRSRFGNHSSSASKHLQLLGLPQDSALDEQILKTAFLQRAKAWHPDRHQGSAKALAESQFKDIQAAYQALRELAGLS